MKRSILCVQEVLAWGTFAGLLLQFYFAGVALFGAASFELHRAWGYMLAIPILLLLVLALAVRQGWRLVGLTVLLVILTIFQVTLPSLRSTAPVVAALHVINALALLGVSATIARQARRQATTIGNSRSGNRAGGAGNLEGVQA